VNRDGACAACVFLDGRNVGEADVIRLLTGGPATVECLANETGRSREGIHNTMVRLTKMGRVRVVDIDGDASTRGYGGGAGMQKTYLLQERR
jgi:hypothetical protein